MSPLVRTPLVVFVALLALLALLASLAGCRSRGGDTREGSPDAAQEVRAEPEPERSHREVVEALLARGDVDVYLDPRKPGVVAPLKSGPRLILKFGRDLEPAIPDLRITDEGISGTLAFGEERSFCSVPWAAVFAVDGPVDKTRKGFVWKDRVPPELRDAGAASSP